MPKVAYFSLENLARVGSSVFSGTLVSCLILDRVEWLHIVLMSTGLLLMGYGYLIAPSPTRDK